jgi:hypothetical protein
VRDLSKRENQNILKLELNEMVELKSDGQLPALKVLNFFSPRPSSFIFPFGKEEFINLFFRLLDFSGKNAEMP